MSTKQEIVSETTFKAWPFSFDFNFACSNMQILSLSSKPIRWTPLQLSIVTSCYKELHLKCGRVPGSIFENLKLGQFRVKNGFSLLFWNVATFISHCVFVIFQSDKVFLTSLLDSCYHWLVFVDPVSGYSKSKLLLKEHVSCDLCYPSFLLWSIFSPLVNVQFTLPALCISESCIEIKINYKK